MKKRGIINAQLAGLIAGLGHKDTFMIGDGGMPIPKGRGDYRSGFVRRRANFSSGNGCGS